MTQIAAAVLVALALVGSAASATRTSGLYGTATRSPIRPVCVEGRPCSEPARNVQLVFTRTSGERQSVRTDSRGKYRIVLRAGRYSVKTSGRRLGSRLQPGAVVVPASGYRRVDFRIDTGIR
jgi:hypothetical protein